MFVCVCVCVCACVRKRKILILGLEALSYNEFEKSAHSQEDLSNKTISDIQNGHRIDSV